MLDRSLVFVTARAARARRPSRPRSASCRRRAPAYVVCDFAGSGQLARAYGGGTRLAERLWAISIDPQDALEEWLRRQPGGAAAVAVLTRSQTFSHFVAAAPGAKELVTIGKAIDLARPVDDPPYDLVVADGPSTGHALGMLSAPRTIGAVAPLGTVGAQARGWAPSSASPGGRPSSAFRSAGGDGGRGGARPRARAPATVGRPLDLIVVNAVFPGPLQRRGRRAPAAGRASLPIGARRARPAPPCPRARRAGRPAAEEARTAVVTLPYLFVPRLGPAEYEALSRGLA